MKTISVSKEIINKKAVESKRVYLSDIFNNDFTLFPKNAVL
jgi:hypothetical protein